MARAYTIFQDRHPYHITARCNNKEWFACPLETVWQVMGDQLNFISHAYNVRIHAFTLMANHFHLLMTTPENNLSESMRWFMRETSRQINFQADRINPIWGGRYYRSLIGSDQYYMHAYKYVYRNPVEAQSVRSVLEYPFSSLRGIFGFERLSFPVFDDLPESLGIENLISWLDTPVEQRNWKRVGKAMRKKFFRLSQPPNRNIKFDLENSIL